MAAYRGMEVPDHLRGVLPHMPLVDETREALLVLSQQWDLVDVLSRVVETGTEVDKTRADFKLLNAALIAALGDESLNKLVASLSARAQVTIDILMRNLFERTADIGFLAIDDDLHRFLKGDTAPSADQIHARLIEYRCKYSVYSNVVVMGAEGHVRAQAGTDPLPAICRDAFVARALETRDAYVETFAPSDLASGAPMLTYAYRIVEPNMPYAAPLGVLALLFRFADESDGIFRHLLKADDWMVLALLDQDGAVLASSDPEQLALASRLQADPAQPYQLIRHAGRRYIAATRATKGYQGYRGPGWRGCALIPIEVAFEDDAPSGAALADRRYRAIARNAHLFPDTVRHIPRRADGIQAELNRTVWNGKLAMPRLNDTTDPAAGNAAARRTLLSEISAAGGRTQRAFADAVGALNRTAIGSLVANCGFSAALAIDLMDRNLYERANDCRWWALTSRFRSILAQEAIAPADQAELAVTLKRINDLYTVYTNLILFDRHGVIQAVSEASQAALVGTMLDRKLVHRFTARADSSHYSVSDFDPSALYNGHTTYIYGAPVLLPSDTAVVVGGIAIIFDSEPQLRAMLEDAGPFDAAGRAIAGSRNLFVDGQHRIIASTAPEDRVGVKLHLSNELFAAATGGSTAQVISMAGQLYAVGVRASTGYREYKGPNDSYRNPVFAVSLLHLGTDDAQVALPVSRAGVPPAMPARASDANRRELATFTLGDMLFAFDRDDTVQAILPDHLVPAPNTPASIVGLTTYRGKGLRVLDARAHLHLPPLAADEPPRPIIVFRTAGRLLGLRVDTLGDIVDIDSDRMSSPGVGDVRQIVKAIVKPPSPDQGTMMLLLDADALAQVLLSCGDTLAQAAGG